MESGEIKQNLDGDESTVLSASTPEEEQSASAPHLRRTFSTMSQPESLQHVANQRSLQRSNTTSGLNPGGTSDGSPGREAGSFHSQLRSRLKRRSGEGSSSSSGMCPNSFKRQLSGPMNAIRTVNRLRLYSQEDRLRRTRRSSDPNVRVLERESKQSTRRSSRLSTELMVEGTSKLLERLIEREAGGGVAHSAAAASLIGMQLRGEALTVSQRVYLMLEEPTSGVSAYVLSVFIRATTVSMAISTTLESIEWITEVTGATPWLFCNLLFNVLFTLEMLARVTCYEPSRASALKDAFIWIDMLTVRAAAALEALLRAPFPRTPSSACASL